jgi:pimeloyl-ACP methyl ester carboxylesterase
MQELAFDKEGSGPALVLIHGTSSTPVGSWGACVPELAKTHTVVQPYLPGSGASPLPDGPIDAAVVAEQIAAVADRAGLDRFAVCGASLGGPIAMKVAATFPQRVSHLVSVCGYASARPSLRFREQLFEAVLPLGNVVVGKLLLSLAMSDQALAGIPADVLDTTAAQIGAGLAPGSAEQIVLSYTIDVEQDLASITAPTLIIGAINDGFVDITHSVLAADAIPGAVLLRLEGPHGITHERSAVVVEAITRFVGPAA